MIPFLTISTFNCSHQVILVFRTRGLLQLSSLKMSPYKITQSVGNNFTKMADCNFALHCTATAFCFRAIFLSIVQKLSPQPCPQEAILSCHGTTQKQLHVPTLLVSVHCSLCTWLYGAVLADEQLIFSEATTINSYPVQIRGGRE